MNDNTLDLNSISIVNDDSNEKDDEDRTKVGPFDYVRG